jgi:hypothetical protein
LTKSDAEGGLFKKTIKGEYEPKASEKIYFSCGVKYFWFMNGETHFFKITIFLTESLAII